MMLDGFLRDLSLPAYSTDAAGRIVSCNDALATLLGFHPPAGLPEPRAPWALLQPDGSPLPPQCHPAARALAERRSIQVGTSVVFGPEAGGVSVIACATPLFDASGAATGCITMLLDTSAARPSDSAAHRLAAIVESSEDAILAKDLDGTIMSWNAGAERLFGYTADEVIGRSITILLPQDRLEEEPAILARIRRGERVAHFETVRRRKDGSLFDISLTVSPVKDDDGRIVGASKIARDITDRRRAEQYQRLLLDEMSHRVKNALVLAGSLVSLSARTATSTRALAQELRDRLDALARAHALTLPERIEADGQAQRPTSLQTLIRAIVAPFDAHSGDLPSRVTIVGDDVPVAPGGPVTALALLLHEFVTNAAKYGALSCDTGRIRIECGGSAERIELVWTERGGPVVALRGDDAAEGFGSLLSRSTVRGQLDGEIVREWPPEGLMIRLTAARNRVSGG